MLAPGVRQPEPYGAWPAGSGPYGSYVVRGSRGSQPLRAFGLAGGTRRVTVSGLNRVQGPLSWFFYTYSQSTVLLVCEVIRLHTSLSIILIANSISFYWPLPFPSCEQLSLHSPVSIHPLSARQLSAFFDGGRAAYQQVKLGDLGCWECE
jgi:hypothetical protein